MPSLALALLVTAAVSFAFRSTRPIGVLAIGLFTFAFPKAACALLIGALLLFLLLRQL
jgi:hypothetical protein